MKKNRKNRVNNDTLNEQATRSQILKDALKRFGPEGVRQIKLLFQKYDGILSKCSNDLERVHVKKVAIAEIYTLMGYTGGLTIGTEVVIPDDEEKSSKLIN